jgi:LL-diaminopimelate aminotransferase
MDNGLKFSDRLQKLPPYLFIEIDRKKKQLQEKGIDIISLGVGDPDLPTPEYIVKAGQRALADPQYHQYPFGAGLKDFREAVALWYRDRFGVSLDPAGEVHTLIGSKEGIGHLPLAFINPGDTVLVPDPGYPVYRAGTILAGGEAYTLPLLEENDFLPDLAAIPGDVLKRAKLLFLNYPNNPTAAVATKEFFAEAVALAKKHGIIVAHDAAYSELYYGAPPLSFLSVEGAKDIGIEFHSLSKTYNMTGWRVAWACGSPRVLEGLSKVKDNYDSGAFSALQKAGVAALSGGEASTDELRKVYRARRDVMADALKEMGWKFKVPEATFYMWVRCPGGYSSARCAEKLLNEAAIVVTPGNGMGNYGEGYIRLTLTVSEQRLKEAAQRMKNIKW